MQIQSINNYKSVMAASQPLKPEAKEVKTQAQNTIAASSLGRDLVSFKGLAGGIRKAIPTVEDLAKRVKNQRPDLALIERKILSAKESGLTNAANILIDSWQVKAKSITANYGLRRTQDTLQNLMGRCRNQAITSNSKNLKEALGIWERRTDDFVREATSGNKTFDESMKFIEDIAVNIETALKKMPDDGFKLRDDMRADRVDQIRDSLRAPEHLQDFVDGARTFVNKYTR